MITMSDTRFPVLCDLDGVVWLSHRPIAGSAEAIARLRRAGHRVVFVTNNSSAIVADQEAALAAIGIPAVGDVLTSAQAAAVLIEPGDRVHVCAGPGVREAVEHRGATVVIDDAEQADAVIVGFHRDFDYEGMRRAVAQVRRGARLIGTNDDATYPTPDGLIPGGGAIVAAVAAGSETQPTIAGKPHEPAAELVRREVGEATSRAVMVGDRPSTDGGFARTLGCRFALVYSGVTAAGESVDPTPDLTGADLASIADQLLTAGFE